MKKQILALSFVLTAFGSALSQNYIWAKSIVGTANNLSNSIQVDAAGNSFVTGYFSGTADFDPSPATATLVSNGQSDIFVAKYDQAGNYLWAINLGGALDDIGTNVQVDAGGNVYVTGAFQGTVDFDPGASTINLTAAGGYDVFLAVYSPLGAYVSAFNLGGTGNDGGNAIQMDGVGNIYIAGYFSGTVDFDIGAGTSNLTSPGVSSDVFMVKYSGAGVFGWAKSVGGAGNELCNAMQLDAIGNVHIIGTYQGTADFDPGAGTVNLVSAGGISDIYFAKYDNSGNYIWAKTIGGVGDDVGNNLQLDGAGNVFLAGYFSSTVDFDPGAGTSNLVSVGNNDIFLCKYDNNGNYVWANGMGGSGADVGSSLKLDAGGNIFLTGSFHTTVDFDASAGTATLSTLGAADVFLAKYDAAGAYLKVTNIGGSASTAYPYGMAMNAAGSVFITGRFQGFVDFDMSANTINLGSISLDAVFLAKYDNVLIGLNELKNANEEFSIYPNPNNGQFYLSGEVNDPLTIEITEATGKVILKSIYKNGKLIDLSSYPKGIYLLRAINDHKPVLSKKIVLQ